MSDYITVLYRVLNQHGTEISRVSWVYPHGREPSPEAVQSTVRLLFSSMTSAWSIRVVASDGSIAEYERDNGEER